MIKKYIQASLISYMYGGTKIILNKKYYKNKEVNNPKKECLLLLLLK